MQPTIPAAYFKILVFNNYHSDANNIPDMLNIMFFSQLQGKVTETVKTKLINIPEPVSVAVVEDSIRILMIKC